MKRERERKKPKSAILVLCCHPHSIICVFYILCTEHGNHPHNSMKIKIKKKMRKKYYEGSDFVMLNIVFTQKKRTQFGKF